MKKVLKGYTFRLYPSVEQKILIEKSFGCSRYIYNYFLEKTNGVVPNDRTFLESLPGVGRKTANVVLGELFHEEVIAVDTHVSRVAIRLGYAKKNDDVYTIEKKLEKKIPKEKRFKLHHQLLLFGRYYCKAIKPECLNCKLKNICKEKRS